MESKNGDEKFETLPAPAEPTTAILRLDLLRTYKLAWLRRDLIAGLVIFAVTIPAGLAYGRLAGLQPINGLYASLLAMGVYAFFGTSRHLIIGAEAAVAIIVFSSVSSVAAGADPARFAALVMIEAIMVGGIQVLAGLTHLGLIADFIPKSVVVGFLNGMALIIIMAMAGNITGIELSQTDFLPRVLEFYANMHRAHHLTLIMGGSCLLGLLLCRLFFRFLPDAVVVAGLATGAVIWWNLGTQGVQLVGWVPAGLPHPGLPPVSFEDIVKLFPIAMGVALVSFVDTTITGRAFSVRGGYQLDHNQELIALGLANVGNGLFQGFAVGASHSRTAVNMMYGGRSQFAGLVATGLLAVFLLHFTSILRNVPVVALSAIIVAAGVRILDPKEVFRIWRTRPASAYISIITTFAVLIAGLMIGILVAVAFAIILVMHRLSRPHETILRPKVPGAGLLVYRFAGPLFFFNASYFFNRVQNIVEAANPPVNFFLINAEAIVDIDINAAEILEELYHYLRRRNITLGICEAKGHFRTVLLSTSLTTRPGFNLYPNVDSLVQELNKQPTKED
ncbi:MAG: SulP family inorganic anion transporter [Desulfobaccales bacterium]